MCINLVNMLKKSENNAVWKSLICKLIIMSSMAPKGLTLSLTLYNHWTLTTTPCQECFAIRHISFYLGHGFYFCSILTFGANSSIHQLLTVYTFVLFSVSCSHVCLFVSFTLSLLYLNTCKLLVEFLEFLVLL